MNSDQFRARVLRTLDKYFERKDCPICDLKLWNGVLHPFAGIYSKDKSEQHWCNGKTHFYPSTKNINEQLELEMTRDAQMELNFRGE